MYIVKHKCRKNQVSVVGEYRFKRQADSRIISITQAQLSLGAYHVTPSHESFGCGRASWRDGTYTETWREYVTR
jgi:hypothetical protein